LDRLPRRPETQQAVNPALSTPAAFALSRTFGDALESAGLARLRELPRIVKPRSRNGRFSAIDSSKFHHFNYLRRLFWQDICQSEGAGTKESVFDCEQDVVHAAAAVPIRSGRLNPSTGAPWK
jgi:hypothetical protein